MESFELTPTATAAHTAALAQLTASREDAKPAALGGTAGWGARVLQAAEEVLGNFVEQVFYLAAVMWWLNSLLHRSTCATLPA